MSLWPMHRCPMTNVIPTAGSFLRSTSRRLSAQWTSKQLDHWQHLTTYCKPLGSLGNSMKTNNKSTAAKPIEYFTPRGCNLLILIEIHCSANMLTTERRSETKSSICIHNNNADKTCLNSTVMHICKVNTVNVKCVIFTAAFQQLTINIVSSIPSTAGLLSDINIHVYIHNLLPANDATYSINCEWLLIQSHMNLNRVLINHQPFKAQWCEMLIFQSV